MPVPPSLLILGCAQESPSAPALSDALVTVLRAFDGDETELVVAVLAIEDGVRDQLDLTADSATERAISPGPLSEVDVADLEHAPRDPGQALGIAVAARSPFGLSAHAGLQRMPDQTPIEPYSPERYDRTFVEGGDCFTDRDCSVLRSWNELTKETFLMTADLELGKDFRWVALDDGRWAMVARSWLPRSFPSRQGSTQLHQSYSAEVWIEDGGSTVRMLSLWAEVQMAGPGLPEDTWLASTRSGIDGNFEAADAWLEGE